MTEFEFNERGIPTRAKKFTLDVPRRREFPAPASGQRARGELEDMVDVLCRLWLIMLILGADVAGRCTTEWLATACSRMDGRPTTPGAVGQILRRWEQLDYAVIAAKPARFVGLTEKGMKLGIVETHRRDRLRRTNRPSHYQWPSTG